MDTFIKIRNKLLGFFYRLVLKPFFFLFDPEDVHDFVSACGKFFGTNLLTRGLTRILFGYKNPILEQTVFGIRFKNPVGLSAGFDKDAILMDILPAVGF